MPRVCGLLWALLGVIHAAPPWANTPLDDYVNAPDPNFKWTDTGLRMNGSSLDFKLHWTGYVLNMTSQAWLTPADSSQPVWWHIMVVIVPHTVLYPTRAGVWITGGHNNGGAVPDQNSEDIIVASELAMGLGAVVTALFQIPNEPIVFSADPLQKHRSEDAIIAFTWSHFINDTSAPNWLLRLPMTKAVVRAMDATTQFMAAYKTPQTIKTFLVAGASKRGWTTWTTAAVDPRVELAVPVVLDVINVIPNIHHQYASYGGWSFALEDYWEQNFTGHLDDPNTATMMQIVDPYAYRARLTMPKLVCNAGGDEFMQPDDTHWWWNDMPSPKNFVMVPNAEHSQATGVLELLPAIGAWALNNLNPQGGGIPSFFWTRDNVTGDIVLSTATKPLKVHMWHASTCNGKMRDFRLINGWKDCECGFRVSDSNCFNAGVLWQPTELNATMVGGNYTYTAHQDVKKGKWVAFFIDVIFPDNDPHHQHLRSLAGAPWRAQGRHRMTPAARAAAEAAFPSASNLRVKAAQMVAEAAPGTHSGRTLGEERGAGFGWPIDWGDGLEFTTEVSIVPNTFPFPDCHGAECYGSLV